jgi:hypothetical protein
MDVPMPDYEPASTNGSRRTRNFIVAIDFGTTFSSVAYRGYYDASELARGGYLAVELVGKYLHDPSFAYTGITSGMVPSDLWYQQKAESAFTKFASKENQEQPIVIDEENEEEEDFASDSDTGSSVDGDAKIKRPSSDPSKSARTASELLWGYSVMHQLQDTENETEPSRRLSRFKLILDDSPHTAKIRDRLSETCKTFKKMRLIEEDYDTIADFLSHLLRHTKNCLSIDKAYTESSRVDFVLCVPAIWSSKALRKMQVAMIKAAAQSGFGTMRNGCIEDLFIVSEPEAAAECLLASEDTALQVRV